MTYRALCLLSAVWLGACSAGGLPDGWRKTPDGSGPRIRWDLEARPLPDVPLPNDVATWPDPKSPTGRRINAGVLASTSYESFLRGLADQLDGWGTYQTISVSFDAPIDTEDLIRRMRGSGAPSEAFSASMWQEHAVYLINLRTGVPVPLDVQSGNFVYSLREPDNYYENDPRGTGSNLIFETMEEDLDSDGELDPGEDTDFDGVLDHPNLRDGRVDGPLDAYDELLTCYERQTDTLLLRPLLPLEETTEYAVVLTDRLRGRDGQPVRSPFDYVHHFSQKDALASLPETFAAKEHIYGDLASRGWGGVAFAWTFTTQSVTRDLRALREGLYGQGPFARLSGEFPPDVVPVKVRGGTPSAACADPGNRLFIATHEQLATALRTVAVMAFGISAEDADALIATHDSVAHVAIAYVDSPYLLGDPDADRLEETWQVDARTGEARVGRDRVPMLITIPVETATHHQPFPVAMYAHGYGSVNMESLAFSGLMARQGIATVALDAQGHGLGLDALTEAALRNLFGEQCLGGFGYALTYDRARDLDRDDVNDSGGQFFTGYVYHTRDTIRQSVLDYMQAIRAVRAFDGARLAVPGEITPHGTAPLVFDGDFNADGVRDLAGDFDGNGTPDLGGPDADFFAWGTSLGGLLSGLLVGAEPYITTAAPVVGAGGLSDVGLRSVQGGVKEAVLLRVMGPLLVAHPSEGPSDDTACDAGERSLRFIAPQLNRTADFEIACLRTEALGEGDIVILTNLFNGEARCTRAGVDGRIRIGFPADEGDLLYVEVFRPGADGPAIDFATCQWSGEKPEPIETVTSFRSSALSTGPGRCAHCATYMGRSWEVGDALVAPSSGMGLSRQTPDLRRILAFSQIALEPADPVNYAPHIFLHPTESTVGPVRERSVLVLSTIGDMNVPVSAGNAYARAAGVLPFMAPDAPDELADYRAPATFAARYGVPAPNDILVQYHVLEGIARLGRHPVPGATDFLFDVDDLSEGQQFFSPEGTSQLAGGIAPGRLSPPLRWVRESRAVTGPDDDVWSAATPGALVSGVLNAMIYPHGNHGFEPVSPRKLWDEGEYLANLIARFFASRGTDLVYHSNPSGHRCLENSSCTF